MSSCHTKKFASCPFQIGASTVAVKLKKANLTVGRRDLRNWVIAPCRVYRTSRHQCTVSCAISGKILGLVCRLRQAKRCVCCKGAIHLANSGLQTTGSKSLSTWTCLVCDPVVGYKWLQQAPPPVYCFLLSLLQWLFPFGESIPPSNRWGKVSQTSDPDSIICLLLFWLQC